MKKEEVCKRLLEKGVKLKIGGCGCCDSPWVRIQIDGEDLVFKVNPKTGKIGTAYDYRINMFS